MFGFFQKSNLKKVEGEQDCVKNQELSDTDKKLRDLFYTDPVNEKELSDIERMILPKIKAPQLYKELVHYGKEKGWIMESDTYPLIYPLLYNAEDTALAVDWRFQDSPYDNPFLLALGWCVYTAMADVYYCDKDWDDLRNKGLVTKLESICGFDYIDEHVEKLFNIKNAKELQDHIVDISKMAQIPFVDAGNAAKPLQKRECLTAAYYYGMKLGMQYLEKKE